ncbi:MAG: carbamoyl phosphate synthase small subunit [Gemmatimonadetes bacterium]|mgnify:CR=1 FL=1|nr:carbamoyl phosphate synthase small subunit [Gemmatimonadota bacterium]
MVDESRINQAFLMLEDGKRFDGVGFGSAATSLGEVVFNTSMTGYQEILTDPSYSGQHVVMTYPLIGNYGVNEVDVESSGPKVAGFVVRELPEVYSSWRATSSIENYLEASGIVGISEVDTRALTRHIRSEGAMRGAIAPKDVIESDLLDLLLKHPVMEGLDLSVGVSTIKPYEIEAVGEEKFHVLAYDCGVKAHSPKLLSERGCRVTVLPVDTSLEEVLALEPDGLFISNGPGDPAAVKKSEDLILGVSSRGIPVFGICLGHQLIARAFGAETFKLPFGHHGANHPVRNINQNTVEITSQNHGFSVRLTEQNQISGAPDLELTHVNLYDGTAEGLAHRERPVFSVQYHPEAAPGPHDSRYLFDQFVELMQQVNC